MDHDLAALTDSPAAGGLDRIRLGPMGGPDPVGALAAGGPFPIVRHDVDPLVIAHFVTLYKAG